jgi:carbamoyl-phosphate synthase large subunit
MLGKNLRILITSAGVATASNIYHSLKKAQNVDIDEIICTADNSNTALKVLADKFYTTHHIKDPEYVHSILEICKKNKINFVFPVHSSEISIFYSNMDLFNVANIKVAIPQMQDLDIFNNKSLFYSFCTLNGLDTIETYDLHELNNKMSFPLYLKPKFGSSSNGHRIVKSIEELASFTETKSDDYILQNLVTAAEATVDCIRCFKTGKILTLPRWRIRVQDGKSTTAKAFYSEEINAICEKVLRLSKFFGACNLQFFKSEDIWKIIEVNPRMSAGGLPLATESGLNIPELLIKNLMYGQSLPNVEIEFSKSMYRYYTEVFE